MPVTSLEYNYYVKMDSRLRIRRLRIFQGERMGKRPRISLRVSVYSPALLFAALLSCCAGLTPAATPAPSPSLTSAVHSSTKTPLPTATKTTLISTTMRTTAPATALTPMVTPSRTRIPTTTPAMEDPFAPSLPAYALGRLGKGRVMAMDVSPNERYLAVASGIGIYLYETNSADGTLKEVWFKPTTRQAVSVAFAPDGRSLAAGLQGQTDGDYYCNPHLGAGGIVLLETDSSDVIKILAVRMRGSPVQLVFSPDGTTVGYIDSSGGDDTGYLWNINDSKPQEIPPIQDEYLETMLGLAFSPDGNRLAYGFYKNTNPPDAGTEIRVLDRKTQQTVFRFGTFDSGLRAIIFSPDSRRLAASDADGRIRVWDMQTGEEVASAVIPNVKQLRFSTDNQQIFVRTDTRILLWDLTADRSVWSLVTHSKGITASADGRRLLSYDENALTVWNGSDGKEIRDYLLSGHEAVYDPVYSQDGREIITVTSLGNIMVWDASTRRLLRAFNVGRERFEFAAAPDSRTLAVLQDNTVQIWDYVQGKPVRTQSIPDKKLYRAAFSPEDNILAVASLENVYLMDSLTGETLMHHEGKPGLAFSPDGRILAFISSDGSQIVLWDVHQDLAAGALNYNWPYGSSELVFSPNGQYLGSAGFGPGVHWWSISDPQARPSPKVDSSWPHLSVAFSPDGKTGAVSSYDILIWELSSSRQTHALSGHTCWSTRVVYSTDGSVLVSGSEDGTVLLWDMTAVLKDV
jgi:WD40 repeat protein